MGAFVFLLAREISFKVKGWVANLLRPVLGGVFIEWRLVGNGSAVVDEVETGDEGDEGDKGDASDASDADDEGDEGEKVAEEDEGDAAVVSILSVVLL